MIKLINRPSANYSEMTIIPKYIILHCIGLSQVKALQILTEKPAEPDQPEVSAHFFIPALLKKAEYPIYQLVPETKKAYHAGLSDWRYDHNLNHCSIGIEFHSPNYANALSGDLDWFHFEPYAPEQIQAGIELLANLVKQFAIEPENILAHSDIAPGRKTDPGATFPWELFAKSGLGVWPKQERLRGQRLDTSISNVQTLLATWGYALANTGRLDDKTINAIQAFQLHFMPDSADGEISDRLVILLENLIDKQYLY